MRRMAYCIGFILIKYIGGMNMLCYKGAKCFYLGLGRWRVNFRGWDFDILCRGGVNELIRNLDRWEVIA